MLNSPFTKLAIALLFVATGIFSCNAQDESTVEEQDDSTQTVSIQDDSDYSQLRRAIANDRTEDLDELEELLKDGVSANAVKNEKTGHSILHYAVWNDRRVAVVRMLLNYGADPNATRKDGISVLQLCFARDHDDAEIANILCEYGANVNAKTKSGTILDNAMKMNKPQVGKILRMFGGKLSKKHPNADLPVWDKILKMPQTKSPSRTAFAMPGEESKDTATDAQKRYADGTTELHLACADGDLERVRELLKAGANAAATDKMLKTPLHYMCTKTIDRKNFGKILDLLLQYDPSALKRKDKSGNVPFVYLFGNMTPVNNHPYYPYQFRAKFPNELMEEILKRDSSQANIITEQKCSPIHFAVICEKEETISLLLKYGAKIEAKDRYGNTPFLLACGMQNIAIGAGLRRYQPQFEIIKLLVEKGANIRTTNSAGWNGLHMVCGCPPVYASTDSRLGKVNAVSLNSAYSSKKPIFAYPFFANYNVVEYLLKLGISPNTKTRQGETVLDIALLERNYGDQITVQKKIKELLLRFGARKGGTQTSW